MNGKAESPGLRAESPIPRSALCAFLCLFAALLSACTGVRPQKGGGSTTSLGGATAPTVVQTTAPENPQTPTTTTVEKSTTREFSEPLHREHRALPTESTEPTPKPSSVSSDRASVPSVSHALVRETVVERSTTQTGAAQKDTARELGAKLANMRGVLWVGVALLVLGPIVGWKLGWFTNGCIAGAVGLLLIILSTVIPGNEAWFGLGGLLLIPLVGFVYYRARHDGSALPVPQPSPGSQPASPSAP